MNKLVIPTAFINDIVKHTNALETCYVQFVQ